MLDALRSLAEEARELFLGPPPAPQKMMLRSPRKMDGGNSVNGLYLLIGVVALAALWRFTRKGKGDDEGAPARRPKREVTAAEVRKMIGSLKLAQVRSGKIASAEQLGPAVHGVTPGVVEGVLRETRNAGRAEELVKGLRSTRYDSENGDHEVLLTRLWKATRPGVTLTKRICDEWETIGFQGKDPATDFRGNGVLGLLNLVYFAESHGEEARAMVAEGGWTEDRQDTMQWYLWAVTGINLTTQVTKMQESGGLDRFFRGDVSEPVEHDLLANETVVAHSQVYSSLMMHFHKKWLQKRPSVMEFNQFVEATVYPSLPADKIERAC